MKKYAIIFSILLLFILLGGSCASAAEINDSDPLILDDTNLENSLNVDNNYENIILNESAGDASSIDDELILDDSDSELKSSANSALSSPADESVDESKSVLGDSGNELSDSLPDVKCYALDMQDFNLYLTFMDLGEGPEAEVIRQFLSNVYQSAIPKQHSNTMILYNDVRAMDKKIVLTLSHGKNLVIDGQGHTVNLGGNDDHDNYISVNSGSLTLKNINFINGYNDDTGSGGAISFSGSAKGEIINCSFKNCWADDYGGAIFLDSANSMTVINSTFIGNTADDRSGGAIFTRGSLTIINSTFESNKAENWGGAVSSFSYDFPLAIDGCTFRNNKAESGGAVKANALNPSENPSYFFGNVAEESAGGLELLFVTRPIKNWVFIGNEALTYHGGAFEFVMTEQMHSIISCVFIGNKAKQNGGAVYQQTGGPIVVELINNIFIDNYAGKQGNLVYSDGDNILAYQNWYGTNNPNFNNAFVNYNAARPRSDVDNNYCVFNLLDVESVGDYFNIDAGFRTRDGGSPQNEFFLTTDYLEYSFDKEVKVKDITIKDNKITATAVTTDFGKVNVNLKIYGIPFSGSFDFNRIDPQLSASFYNIIKGDEYIELIEVFMDERINGEVTVSDLISNPFKIDIVNGYGCAPLNITDLAYGKYEGVIEYSGTDFFANASSPISFELKEKSTPENVHEFTTLQNKIDHATDNELILDYDYLFSPENDGDYVDGVILSSDNFVLDGNGHSIDGNQLARIFMITAENVTIRNLNILNGNSSSTGGVVLFNKSGKAENCNFTGNSANEGGAVYFNSGIIENCSFTDNHATLGGALYLNGGLVEYCSFTGNDAQRGGAVYLNGGSMKDCILSLNHAFAGGALYYIEGSIENCTFDGNSALNGGAILFNKSGMVEGSNFFNNNATLYGGALYSDKMDIAVSNSNFIGNYAKYGSAIYSFGHLDIEDSVFLENKGESYRLDMDYEDHRAVISFYSYTLYINAVSSNDINFDNVTYWNGSIANTDDAVPDISSPGINITIEVIDYIGMETVRNVTLVTDNEGTVYYNPTDLEHQLYIFKVYHPDDAYYTYLNTSADFIVYHNSSSVDIDIEDKAEFAYPNVPDRINFTIVNRTEEVRVLITDMYGTVYVDSLTDLDYVMIDDLPLSHDYYNITVFNVGNMEIEPSKESKLFKVLKATSSIGIADVNPVEYPHEFEFLVDAQNFTSMNVFVCDIDGNIVFEEDNITVRWFDIPVLPVGQYNLTVVNNGDDVHFESEDSTMLIINKGHVFASFAVGNVVYGNPSVFRFMVDSNGGNYTLDINGNPLHLSFAPTEMRNVSMELPAGDYLATLTYDDENYEIYGVTELNFKVLPYPDNVVIHAYNSSYGELSLIVLEADIDGNYSVDVNGTVKTVEVINNTGSVDFMLNPGNYSVNASFDNSNYDLIVTAVEFTVNKALNEVFIIPSVSEDFPDHVSIKVRANADGIYNLLINKTNKQANVVNGFDIIFMTLSPGTYEVKGFFYDPNYDTVITNATFEVPEVERQISISVENLENSTLILAESNFDGVYMLNVSGDYYPIYIVDGKGNTTLSLEEGNYSLDVVLDNGKFLNAANGSNLLEVVHDTAADSRIATQIICNNMTTTAVDVNVDGRIGKYFYITLKDSNGNALANKKVQIGFNGKAYDRTTDSNGKARLQINLKNAGTYTFAVAFLGDEDCNASFVVAKIVVNKQKGSLTVPAKSYKASAKTKSLTATFKTASGKALKGKKITFTVNGKSYSATTNAKGLATVKVSLNKKGTYTFTAKFAGNNVYAAISKKAKLTIK